MQEHDGCVLALVVSNDTTFFLTSSLDKTIRVWNRKYECVKVINREYVSTCMCLLPNDILVCGSNDGELASKYLKKTNTTVTINALHSIKAHDGRINSILQISLCKIAQTIKIWEKKIAQKLQHWLYWWNKLFRDFIW